MQRTRPNDQLPERLDSIPCAHFSRHGQLRMQIHAAVTTSFTAAADNLCEAEHVDFQMKISSMHIKAPLRNSSLN
jgi:hypothetical protein